MSFTTRFSFMFQVWFLLSGIFGELYTFNVNLDNVQILKDSNGSGNMFGYSAALYTSDDGGIDAMIGAPNRSTIRTEDRYAKGKVVIFKNILIETKRTEEEFYYKNTEDKTDSSDEGFGSTVVAADSTHALVCSPALKDSRNPTYTFTLGRCTLRGHQSNLDINPYYSSNRSDYHIKIGERHYLLNGLATLGFSADIDEKFIVIGAPGVLNFEGKHNITF
ncbi:integrin alpha-9-like isoform X3 [Biomphalaria pfeifferi]|uniref:Integrin alpha-9-like isoform X3 n=1 Tax=Biomphalaria pfeifferi TaxID=112525 RepID=A0AAD8FP71_BIOPF|nr:integrin alpha-9-like isoform X3 [Biomphalaria pfeifferi]